MIKGEFFEGELEQRARLSVEDRLSLIERELAQMRWRLDREHDVDEAIIDALKRITRATA